MNELRTICDVKVYVTGKKCTFVQKKKKKVPDLATAKVLVPHLKRIVENKYYPLKQLHTVHIL